MESSSPKSIFERSPHGKPKLGVTRMAAALSGVAFTGIVAWTLSSGLDRLPPELWTSRENVELSLPYTGVCRSLTVFADGREIPTTYKDIKAGLARFSLPLSVGKHDLEIRFGTLVPGWSKSYPLAIVVDRTAPRLSFDKQAVPSKPRSSTTKATLGFAGKVDPDAQLFVGERRLSVDAQGRFGEDVPLAAGWNNLLVRAEDKAGNRTLKKLSIFRDVDEPKITWATAPGQSFAKPEARLELSIVDDGPLGGLVGKVDDKPIVWHRKPQGRWLGVTPSLSEGRHKVDLKVADLAGRVTTSQREILIDSTETLGGAVLGLGAKGADVAMLHQRLADSGYLSVPLGSVFTFETKRAVEAVQVAEGLPLTGFAGPQTLAALGPRVYVNLGEFSLVLKRPGQPDRRWAIASGSSEFPTPPGVYSVHELVEAPSWLPPKSDWAKDAKPVDPGPDNPLGTRWIGLDWGGIGIHGTNAPWTVGSASSHGCIRMECSQVEELFGLVEVGTPVVILSGAEDDPVIDKYWPRS